jgi:hypothetical protein
LLKHRALRGSRRTWHLQFYYNALLRSKQASKVFDSTNATDRGRFPAPPSFEEEIVMMHRKHLALAFALLSVSMFALGCAEDATAPDPQQDEAPLLAPINVQAAVVNGGDIRISWNASSQPNVAGYNVYRVDLSDDAVARLNPSLLASTSIVDASARFGREYDYRVTAVSDRNTESRFTTVTIRNREAPPQDRRDRKPDEID